MNNSAILLYYYIINYLHFTSFWILAKKEQNNSIKNISTRITVFLKMKNIQFKTWFKSIINLNLFSF
jgi:hypothetical protein